MQVSYLKSDINRFAFLLSVLLFRLVLDFSYTFFISELFLYDGFGYEFDSVNYSISWVVYLSSMLMLSDRIEKVSHYFFATAVLSVIAPLTSMYGLDASRPLFPVLISVGALLWVYIFSRLSFISFKGLPAVKSGRGLAITISAGFVVFLLFWFFLSGAKPNLDISKVYEYRQANADLAAQGILAYTNNWTFQIFSVYLICFSLYAKRYFWFFILLAAQVCFYAFASHKSILFLPVLVVSVWVYFRNSNSLLMLPLAFISIILVAVFANVVFDDLWLTSLLSRRVFFMPASLSFIYFDFFSTNAHTYWSNSILSGLIVYPYGDVAIPYVIGEYLGAPEMGANNGFVSSGYAHAGVLGVFSYATIVGVLLRLVDDLSSGYMPVWMAVAISIVPLRSLLISSDLFTVMLTHGFAVAVFLMYLSRKREVVSM
ncbi:hypothetical protein D3C77_84060 [compost metagenome]